MDKIGSIFGYSRYWKIRGPHEENKVLNYFTMKLIVDLAYFGNFSGFSLEIF